MRHIRIFIICVLAVVGAVHGTSHAQQSSQQRGTVRVGYDYATGKYGTDFRATSQTTRVAASAFVDDWTFDINLPYLRRDVESAVGARGNRFGPRGGLIGGGGSVPPGRRITHTITEGMGDVTTTASRYFYGEGAESVVWELGATVKWNTGDANKNLGSGERDYTLLTGAFKRSGNWNFGGSLTYTVVGENASVPVNDVWGASADVSYRAGANWRLGGSFAWEQSAVAGAQAPRSVTAFVSRELGPAARLQLSVNRGMSDASPAWGGGASLTLRF